MRYISRSKNAIALLITVLFVIVITVAIGVGLAQVNNATKIVKDENFMYESTLIVEDVLEILKKSPDVSRVAESENGDELFNLLSSASFIPLESSGVSVILKLSSARAKVSPLAINARNIDAFREFLNLKMINNQYADILLDNMSKIKADNSYNSAIFDEKPYLFRDYIASKMHIETINEYFSREYNDNSLENIAFDELFYYSSEANTSIDLNYATREVWELLLGVTQERAEFLVQNRGMYSDLESLALSSSEAENLKRFKTSFFEPIVFVEIEIEKNESRANITFEYDIKKKKGSNFVYEI